MKTTVDRVPDGHITFTVRKIEGLKKKPGLDRGQDGDPFAPPYDPDLVVSDVPPAHVALLNKFPVISEHLLVVTRDFADQEELLTEADFAALVSAMDENRSLGFYNGGRQAGASQPHKHLQVVPLPLGDDGTGVPLERHLGQLPFCHAAAALDGDRPPPASGLLATYLRLWKACGYEPGVRDQPVPYNLLLTRRHMWLVPRRMEGVEGIEVNALGFAGALLANDAGQANLISRMGPLTLLQRVARDGEGIFLGPV